MPQPGALDMLQLLLDQTAISTLGGIAPVVRTVPFVKIAGKGLDREISCSWGLLHIQHMQL